ncbi:MAG: hypothetical protein ABGW75_02285, partial [Pirellulales bacterium]
VYCQTPAAFPTGYPFLSPLQATTTNLNETCMVTDFSGDHGHHKSIVLTTGKDALFRKNFRE